MAHCVRQAAVARAAAATAVERRASRCRVRRWLASWCGRLVASTRAALARSARTAPLHTTVDAGAPPAGAVPGLMRRRARVGGCSEAWRELYVRLDTKSAPWSDDNGPHLVFGWRWSEGVLPHHPERTTGRSVPVGSGHHCEAAPKGTYAALISRPRAVCRARTAPTTAAKRVRKLNEGSLTVSPTRTYGPSQTVRATAFFISSCGRASANTSSCAVPGKRAPQEFFFAFFAGVGLYDLYCVDICYGSWRPNKPTF